MNIEQSQNSSRAFFLAFQRCMGQVQLPNGQVEFLGVPAVVNAAFSVELGFKALVLRSGRSVSGHKLNDLFCKLDAPTQQLIVEAVGLERQVFDTSLETVSNAFIEWRYIYERESAHVDMAFLSSLANATQDAVTS